MKKIKIKTYIPKEFFFDELTLWRKIEKKEEEERSGYKFETFNNLVIWTFIFSLTTIQKIIIKNKK